MGCCSNLESEQAGNKAERATSIINDYPSILCLKAPKDVLFNRNALKMKEMWLENEWCT